MNRGLRKEMAFLAGLAALASVFRRNQTWATVWGAVAAGLYCLPANRYSFEHRSVLITGGSRGLGLALARNFLQEGAYVTLLARDAQELERARNLLEAWPESNLLTISCDVTDSDALASAFRQARQQFGGIDVLVNNAGTITVGPFESMEQADFTALFNLQVHAVVNAIQQTLPFFLAAGEGRVVNICSIGGKIPVPHMSTYAASKFALAGLSETVTAELAPHNIRVTTVYPGLMRTGSPIQAIFKGNYEKEYAWFSTGDVAPIISVTAEKAARIILDAVREGSTQVTFPLTSRLAHWSYALFPEIYSAVMGGVAKFMPQSTAKLRKTGAESQGWLERQIWYWPFKGRIEKAEHSLNQQEKFDANFNMGI